MLPRATTRLALTARLSRAATRSGRKDVICPDDRAGRDLRPPLDGGSTRGFGGLAVPCHGQRRSKSISEPDAVLAGPIGRVAQRDLADDYPGPRVVDRFAKDAAKFSRVR